MRYGFCKIVIAFLFLTVKLQAQYDSLSKIISSPSSPDTLKMKALYRLSALLIYNNPDTVNILSGELLNIALKNKSLFWQSNAYTLKGAYCFLTTSNAKAVEYHEKALKIRREAKDKNGIANSLNNLGTVYVQMDFYTKALEYFLESLKLFEEMKDEDGISMAYGNIGSTYKNLGKYDKSIEYQLKSLKHEKKIGNREGEALCYVALANCYERMDKIELSIEYEYKSLEINKQLNNVSGLAMNYKNLAVSFANQHNINKALEYYNKSKELELQLNDKEGLVLSKIGLGDCYYQQKDYKRSLQYGMEALTEAKLLELKRATKEALKLISDSYKKSGEPGKALPYYEEFVALKDSLQSEETQRATYRLELKYEYDKKEGLAKAEQMKKDILVKEEHRIKNIIILSVCAVLLLVIILAINIAKNLKENKRKNLVITNQKLEVERQKGLIEEKQKEILDSIHYAKRIQDSLLPKSKYIVKHLNKHRDN